MYLPNSTLVFLLSIGPMMILAVILHEVGHVVAAKCAGIPVAAWGVGYRSPWYHRRIADTTFYLGRPLSGGLTICVQPLLERQPIREFLLILGGPIASALGLVVGAFAMEMVISSDLLATWTFVSAIFVLLSSVPFIVVSGKVWVPNDAYQLIRILYRGRENPPLELGASLSSMQALVELLTQISCDTGSAYFHSSIGIIQAMLGNVTGARDSLRNLQVGSDSIRTFAYAQAVVAVCGDADDAEHIIASSRNQCRGDATDEFSIDCLIEQWRIGRGLTDQHRLNELHQQALAASRRDWLYFVDVLGFRADTIGSADDLESRCRRLLREYRHQLNGVTKAWALAITTERLAAHGDMDRARVFLAEAQSAIATEASMIDCVATREAYLRSATEPLQEALRATNVSMPSLIAEMCKARPGRRRIFAYIALAFGTLAITASVAFAFLLYFGQHSPKSGIAIGTLLPAVFCALLALIARLICIFRSEQHKWPALSTALVLVILTLAIAVLIH